MTNRPAELTSAKVIAVSSGLSHRFSKRPQLSIRLLEGLGVEGDAHMGERVKHRSRARYDPMLPNLRQVHLVDTGMVADAAAKGFALAPGAIGENILLDGPRLIDLPRDTIVTIGTARLRLTGLRNPCIQMDRFAPGLMAAMLDQRPDGELRRLAGVMAVVEAGGDVAAGDMAEFELPDLALPLKPV